MGTGNIELGELLVGEANPGLIVDVGVAVGGKGLEWELCGGGISGWA